MPRAIYKDIVLADSPRTQIIEGNHYFPPETVNTDYLIESTTHTVCPWKGLASYYTLTLDNEEIKDFAWYYPSTKSTAKTIENHIAFYRNKGVTIEL